MGRIDEKTRTTMEVVSIATKVVTKRTQVAPNIIEVAIKIVHPSTLYTIVKIEEVTKNLYHGDETRMTPMVEQIFFDRIIE